MDGAQIPIHDDRPRQFRAFWKLIVNEKMAASAVVDEKEKKWLLIAFIVILNEVKNLFVLSDKRILRYAQDDIRMDR